jgi:uncharacterized protein YjdB
VCYRAHVQNIGWQTRDADPANGRDANEWCDGEVAGTTGQSLRMEAVRIYVRQ